MENIIGVIITSIISTGCFILSTFQFKERGYLFNNAYIYASKEERLAMNKSPYYAQSGIVFLLIGIAFLLIAAELFFQTGWLYYLEAVPIVVVIVYAIVSSVKISKLTTDGKKQNDR